MEGIGSLGIIAGRGDLPRRIAESCRDRGRPYHVVALDGFSQEWVGSHPHSRASILAIGRIIGSLRDTGCEQVVMAGGVDRPKFDALALDRKALSWLPRLVPATRKGDDALLRTVRTLFEEEGFRVVGTDELLDLTASEGVIGNVRPGDAHLHDIVRAEEILSTLAPLDVGQACIVAEGRVLGIETIQGTDALLHFVARTRTLSQTDRGGVLVKRAKVGQDRRIDAPTIGEATIQAAAEAGLDGIAIEARAVQIVDPEAVTSAADRAGLFLWARP